MSWAFDSKILADDNVLVEPYVGLRPWVAAEIYERGVRMMLGDEAVNAEKDLAEGLFRTYQCVWGLDMDTITEEIHLPERRILKGANLLADSQFDYGNKDITVRAIQKFRGITTGWTAIVNGLRNELKAADRFLCMERDGSARARPKVDNEEDAEEVERAWQDLWELFEATRWLCARPETWPSTFGGGMRELLPVRERLALPGEWQNGAVFVSSDATKTMIAAIDWTNGLVMRMKAGQAAKWVQQCGDDSEVAIQIAEMLSFLAFACKVGDQWRGKVVLYGGDNQVVRAWIETRKSGTAIGRLLARTLNMVEMRFRCTILPAWWRTYHNAHADLLTRCTDQEFAELVARRKWHVVDVVPELAQAVKDSEQFGPCLLAWGDGDRCEMMRLKERRLRRQVPAWGRPSWDKLDFVELCGQERRVCDFVVAAEAAGCKARRAAWKGPVGSNEIVMASFPPDQHGKVAAVATNTVLNGEARLVVFEGPRCVLWEATATSFTQAGWNVHVGEFVTTEFGEAAARRRVCLVASMCELAQDPLTQTTSIGERWRHQRARSWMHQRTSPSSSGSTRSSWSSILASHEHLCCPSSRGIFGFMMVARTWQVRAVLYFGR